MNKTKLTELRRLAEAASKVSKDWWADHNETFVGAKKITDEHDWYWITGDMSRPDDGYSGETTDEDYRGTKEVIQTHCRFLASANPAAILELLDTLEKAVEIVSFYADVNSWIKYHPRAGFNYESDSACVLKDHSDKEFIVGEDKSGCTVKFYKESFNVGGKRAREFLASMEGKK